MTFKVVLYKKNVKKSQKGEEIFNNADKIDQRQKKIFLFHTALCTLRSACLDSALNNGFHRPWKDLLKVPIKQ